MDIKKLLPFLDDQSLSLYVEKIKEGKVSVADTITALPFLSRNNIKEIYQLIVDNKIDMKLNQLLPFMEEEDIEELYNKVINNEIPGMDEETILPFLGQEKIKSLFMDYLNKL